MYDGSMFRNPNVNTSFWKERWSNENEHKYKSTIKGVYLGRIMSVPVTDQFASRVNKSDIEDPVQVAQIIKSSEKNRKDKFPVRDVFGTNRSMRRIE